MKIFSFFCVCIILISCEEKTPSQAQQLPKIEITNKDRIISIDSSRINYIKDSSIVAFYNAIENNTFWLENSNRKNLISLFNSADKEGLFLKDFDLIDIQHSEKNIDNLTNNSLIDYDILLTKNLNRYIQKVSIGTLNPNTLYTNWDLKINKVDPKKLLLNFQKKDSFNFALKEIIPNHIVYKKLKSALAIINSLPKYTFNKTEIKHKIVLNDTNLNIIDIKKKLVYWKDLKPLDSLNSIYDASTELAVKKFQMRHGLATDGIIGIETVQALNYTKEERKKEIIINMERWRWYPRIFEAEYLIINIPNYTLQVIKNNDTVRTHKVIIGKAARKTPVLSSKLSLLVFNPTWTIPPTILKNDVIPTAKRDPNYFKNKNITIFNSSNKAINPRNWNIKKALNYRYVQSPGLTNALGLVKFIFPNRFSIYLHDTNSRGYFDNEIRALSSGCIRVQHPFELAEYLLNNPEKWNIEKINLILKTNKPIQVLFKKAIYIHIFYWTSWSENGSLQFRDDLYNYNVGLYEKLHNF